LYHAKGGESIDFTKNTYLLPGKIVRCAISYTKWRRLIKKSYKMNGVLPMIILPYGFICAFLQKVIYNAQLQPIINGGLL
jgi:hypothetical protein